MPMRPQTRSARASLLSALLCAAALPLSAQETRTISGEAIYLPRIALTPDAVLMAEAEGFAGEPLAAFREATDGAQVPLPFTLEIPTGAEATVRLGIAQGGRMAWLSAGIPVASGEGDADLGEVVLRPFVPMGFTSAFRCGDRLVQVGFAGEDAVMDTGEGRVRMAPVPAASGARFEAPDDAGTWFWSQGDSAMVSIAGVELPECSMTFPMDGEGYTARGNEPFWRADVAHGRMEIVRLDFDDLDLPVTATELTPDGDIVIEAWDRDQAIRGVLVRRDGICRDTMSGMPFPESADLSMGDNVMNGCGGDPADLLTGGNWIVTDIGGEATLDETPPTLLFDAGGRVAGTAGCNRWFAGFELTGEGLSFGQAGTTMMACPDPLAEQERRFLDALGQAFRHDFEDDGTLVLYGPDGPLLRARRAT